MTDKAYIVVNEQQEREVLKRLEKEGCSWNDTENTPPTEWHLGRYPYAIFVKDGNKLVWGFNVDVSEVEILAEDKQDKVKISKEEQMSDKYVVSQKFMNKLDGWKIDYVSNSDFLDIDNIGNLPPVVSMWCNMVNNKIEQNNRLIAIIRWVNGEDVFEVEKPKKWIVRSKQIGGDGDYNYFRIFKGMVLPTSCVCATKFNTREEAESWANSHQEVVEVEE